MDVATPEPKPRCGAKIKGSNPPRYCRRYPVPGRKRCDLHGGKSLSGVNSPTYKHGRYSKDLPVELMTAYHAAVGDPDLLEMRSEAALLQSFIADSLGRMDGSMRRPLWREARASMTAFRAALARSDREGMGEALDRLDHIIAVGESQAAARQEVRELVQDKVKVVSQEQKRIVAMEQMITAERAATLFGALLNIVGRYISDPGTYEAMKTEAMALFRLPDKVA